MLSRWWRYRRGTGDFAGFQLFRRNPPMLTGLTFSYLLFVILLNLVPQVGPFLLPSDAPGGAELPPIAGPVPGKMYIADPARVGPVTGSSLPPFTDSTGQLRNHNIFH